MANNSTTESSWHTFIAWGDRFIDRLPMILFAIVFMVVVFMLSGWVKKIAARILRRRSGNKAVATVMAGFISSIFILIGVFIALSILGLDQTVSSLLAGAGILGLVLGLALQDSLSSAIAGIIMTTRKSYNVGDFVETNGFLGTITEINLRNTTILQTNGVVAKVPNKLVLNNPLTNYTITRERRIDFTVNVGYKEDLQKIELMIRNAIIQHVEFNTAKDLEVFFTEFGASSIHILVRFWISKFKQSDALQAQSDAVKAVKKTFDANGIEIPYPIQVMQVKQ